MSRFLSSVGLVGYVILAAAAMLWWAPHFFASNLHIWPELNYRYVAATGIPFSLLLMTVAARQSLMPRFSLALVLQAVLAGLALMLGLMSFQFLPQAVFFCAVHLGICALALAWNLTRYRRELQAWNKREAALRA
ncbi:MAG: hypothetical protein JWQ90_1934 [Hydrocarboniphaga sp.]|uniref:hypothetical protein n=1 Tax=Hydrocarboniphaga sp. TaxID=2033016 RepID=UPI002609D7D0|nr:hypothetical protein [Hydrocarboniphaga sp.]MDB5969484.1 hypothetical protein [Hydrocarboniphaga sp.]